MKIRIPEIPMAGRIVRAATVILILIVACVGPVGAPARGQSMDEAIDMGFDMLSRRGCDQYAAILGLDDDQEEAARALFDGYVRSARAMAEELKAVMQSMNEKLTSGDFSGYQKEMAARMKEFQGRSESLQQGFFDDLMTLLREDQAEKWPKLERFRLREELMQMSLISGSAVDLGTVAQRAGVEVASDPALAGQLEQWELDVDKPLRAMKQAAKEAQEKQSEAMARMDMSNPGAMMEEMNKMVQGMLACARQVRDTNRQHERLILGMLPADQAARFDREFLLRSFPRVYRKSHAAKALIAAEKFADLSDDQRQQLANIRLAYERDLGPVNAKWALELERKEDSGGGPMQMWMEMVGGSDPNDPLVQARKARRDLDDQTRDRVVAALTPDQASRLPSKGTVEDNPWADYQALQEEEAEEPGH